MSRPVQPLSYDSAVGRPNRWARRAFWVAAILFAAALGSVWIGPLWQQGRLLYWQHQCAIHEPTGQQYPRAWTEFGQLASPPGIRSSGTLFLHELVSPSGHRRIVAVNLREVIGGSGPDTAIRVDTWAIVPATWPIYPPRLLPGMQIVGVGGAKSGIAFDTGRIDPARRSHFVISGSDPENVIDGWLLDDDSVKLEHR